MIKYSVIVPVYNVESYLEACLDSVLVQATSSEYEIILIDDGSRDCSGSICDKYAEKFSSIRVVHTENRGVSCARNLAVELAEGTYILYLDSDDFWKQGLLTELDRMAQKDPDVMVFGNVRWMEDGSGTVGERDNVIPKGQTVKAFLEEMFSGYAVPRFYSCCYAIRKELLVKNGIRFREDLKVSEDFDYIMRFLAVADSIVGTGEQLYVYRIRSGSATSSRITQKKLMDNLTTKAQYFRHYGAAALANIYGDNALMVAGLSRTEVAEARRFLRENRDIWRYVSQPPLKLGCFLVTCFGDYGGARIYRMIRSVTRCLLKR